HLRNILFEEIRTKRNLSYAPGAWASSIAGRSIGRLSVSTVYPDSSIKIMYHELEKMKNGDFDEVDLNSSRQVFITRYYMQKMTNSQTANSLFYAQRYADSWRHAFSYKGINSVDKASVTRAFQ